MEPEGFVPRHTLGARGSAASRGSIKKRTFPHRLRQAPAREPSVPAEIAWRRATIRRVIVPRHVRAKPFGGAPRATAALLVLVLAACGTTTTPSPSSPSAGPSSPPPSTATATASPSLLPSASASSDGDAAIYAQIETDVQAIRELRATSPVRQQFVDATAMTKVVTDEVEKGTPRDVQLATERAFKALGLLPPDASLEQLNLELLTSQVAGLYEPAAKTLYVLSKAGAPGPVERVTFAHEFDHALQDQNFGLANLKVDQVGEGDRDLAHLSVAEGDATVLMSLWAQQHLTPAETLQLLTESSDPKQLETLRSMPSILRETLLFPYQTGLSFVTGLRTSGGWAAVDGAYTRPPASTEQLLHPEKYAANEAVLPIDVPADLAKQLGPGWRVTLTDSLGEFQTRIWLRDVGRLSEADADAAAAGWGGDRLVLATGPSGGSIDDWALALVTRWDTSGDAAAFQSATLNVAGQLQATGRTADVRTLPDGRVVFLVAPNRTVYAHLASAFGTSD